MPLITLTTDFGLKDHYVGVLKGELLKEAQDIRLIDISHNIKAFDIFHAAFVINEVATSFPKETVHVVMVNSFYNANPEIIIARYSDQWFIAPDNGLFSLVWEDLATVELFRLRKNEQITSGNLNRLFAHAALDLADGIDVNEFADKVSVISSSAVWKPIIEKDYIRAAIIYFDHFENAVVNLRRDEFENARGGRRFVMMLNRYEEFQQIANGYGDVGDGDKVCFFNRAGYLEIAVNKGNAQGLFGLSLHDIVQIEFK